MVVAARQWWWLCVLDWRKEKGGKLGLGHVGHSWAGARLRNRRKIENWRSAALWTGPKWRKE
jgi:hypothetical protein